MGLRGSSVVPFICFIVVVWSGTVAGSVCVLKRV